MRLVFIVVLLIGVGLAGFAVYMAQGYIAQYQTALAQEKASNAQKVKLTQIYVAKRPLVYGEEITAEDAQLVSWPVPSVPEGAFATAEALFPDGQPKVRIVLRPIETNEPLLAVKVTEPGQDAGITSRLSKGMRAFAINVDVSSGVSGFLRPGDRVDVYWTGTAGKSKVTKLIEPGIRLIAVDQTSDTGHAAPLIARTVTVEGSPKQVAALAQAQSTGKLSLSLVGATDETIAEGVEIDQNTLLGIVEETEVVEAEPQRVCSIKTRRGAEVVEIPIPCTD